ncbi:MAG: M20/M25/M40 family metallo-hydrolase [Acidobacteria bacterium]|nr:M20/M25/M40 family metallo-hydrolase [Acidobacteriota bacterium]
MRTLIVWAAAASLGVAAAAQAQAPQDDRAVFAKIKAEGTERSQLGAVFDTLTTDIGPRLTASPAHKRAVEFMRARLASYGLANVHTEPFAFGRGWEMQKVVVELVEPRYLPLIAYADGWSASTAGEILAAPVTTAGKSPEEIAAMADRLKGAIVMTEPIMTNFVRQDRPNPSDPGYKPDSAAYATSVGRRPETAGAESPRQRAQRASDALKAAGAGVILKPSIGEHGTVFVTGRDGGPGAVPSVTMSAEQYNMIMRLIDRKVPVKLRVNVQTKFYDDDNGNAYNVIAELPGSDPAVRDEVVMLGAHLDSWHTGVGATDNADASSAIVEAIRILEAIDASPRRTIRIALWGGEEQGLLGSRAWVEQHLAGDANRAVREKFDVYFNMDNGTGPVYGFYEQQNPGVGELFDGWLAPLKELGARKNTRESIGSTDHLSFTSVGVPGFNPIQDYENYDVREHHTNMDTVERLQLKDVQEASIAMAWFAYKAANAESKIARPPAATR